MNGKCPICKKDTQLHVLERDNNQVICQWCGKTSNINEVKINV